MGGGIPGTTETSKTVVQLARDGDTARFCEHLAQFSESPHDLNRLDEKKNSALHYAARYSNLAIVNILLENHRVVVDNAGSDQMTPLHYAARYGKNETERNISGRSEADDVGVLVVEALVGRGADINKPDQYKLCPLHHAAMRGNIRVVECLASKEGILLDVRDDQNSTPLQIAATYGNKEVVKILLGRPQCYPRVF